MVAAVAALAVVDLIVAVVLARRLHAGSTDPSVLGALVPTATVVLLYALAGPLLLVAESSRSDGSAFERALGALPLARRDVRALLWLPPAVIALLSIALLLPPGFAALVTTGLHAGQAAAVLVATTTVATATAAALLTVCKLVLRGDRWRPTHYPVALLAFELALVAVLASAVDERLAPSLLDRALVVPVLLDELQAHGTVDPALAVAAAVGGLLVTAAGMVAGAALSGQQDAPDVLVRWRPAGRPRLATGELVRLVRVPHLATNVVGSFVISVAIVVVLWRVPPSSASGVASAAVVAVGVLAGVPVRLLRATVRLSTPQPQLAGIDRRAWVRALNAGALVLFAVGVLPLAAALPRSQVRHGLDAATTAAVLITCLAVAVALSWAVPGTVEVDASQVVATLMYLVATSVVMWLVSAVADRAPLAALGLATLALVGACALGSALEPGRWLVRGSSLPGRPSPSPEVLDA
jgi:hypothetical protein